MKEQYRMRGEKNMFCKYCGNQVDDDSRFCQVCGKPVALNMRRMQATNISTQSPQPGRQDPRSYEPYKGSIKHKKRLSSVLTFVLGLAVVAVVAVVLLFGGILSFGSISTKDSKTKVEGDGFNTPEAAAAGYIEALKEQDLDKMLSAFAVETYCDNYDTAKRVKYEKSMLWSDEDSIISPTESDFVDKKNEYIRQAYILGNISNQAIMLSKYESEDDFDLSQYKGEYYDISTGQEVDEIVEGLYDLPDLSKLEIEKIFSIEEFDDMDEGFFHREMVWADYLGADGYKSVGVSALLNGRRYIFTMDMAKYQDRWYIVSLPGYIGRLLGMNGYLGGLIAYDDIETNSSYNNFLGDGKQTNISELEAIYAGSRQEYLNQISQLEAAGIGEDQLDAYYKAEIAKDINVKDIRKTSIGSFSSFDEFADFFGLNTQG